MKYAIMTLEEAQKVAKKDAIVLVSVQDLNDEDCNTEFYKTRFGECQQLLEEAQTIAKVCTDFAAQLRLFSEAQKDVMNYTPKGDLKTILFKK